MYYMIVEAKTVEKLQVKVNNCIKAGFIPHGGLATRPPTEYNPRWFYQAMINQMEIKDEK